MYSAQCVWRITQDHDVINLLTCSPAFNTLINSSILPIAAVAATSSVGIIVVSYLFGQSTRNDKLLEWSKTEIFQILISIISAVLIVSAINGFCSVRMDSLSSFFGLSTAEGNIFDGAKNYLMSAADFTHKSVIVSRYYLAGFQMLEAHSLWQCDWGCIFGSSGHSVNYDAGYASIAPGVSLSFNTSLFAYLSSLNYLFILLFIDTGLVLFFLPLGIFLRSMPYMRTLGSLFIALSLSFLLVYPSVIASFSLIFNSLFHIPDLLNCYINNETKVEDIGGFSGSLNFCSYTDEVFVGDDCSGNSNPREIEPMKFAGAAFLAGVFFPTIAMLAAIASLRFITRMLGEEVDLSRIVQMI